ncbi:MAG: hypothetical protein JWQ44_2572 [Chthoniobacter sp.]|nr:hypothetical protein [Chthoniobacter sp.]
MGLQWANPGVIEGTAQSVNEGYYRGTVSPRNVAFDSRGDPASISKATPFTLESAFVTACFTGVMQLSVQGFLGMNLYDRTCSVNQTAPTAIDFDYAGLIGSLSHLGQAASLPLISYLGADTGSPEIAPVAGRYSGVLRVTKRVDGVITFSSVRANAIVSAGGLLTLVLADSAKPDTSGFAARLYRPKPRKGSD